METMYDDDLKTLDGTSGLKPNPRTYSVSHLVILDDRFSFHFLTSCGLLGSNHCMGTVTELQKAQAHPSTLEKSQ